MNDLISRRAAIDALAKNCKEVSRDLYEIEGSPEYCRMVESIAECLKDIPPAQRWIPVTERLPEDDGNYLIWFRYKSVLGGFQEDMAMEYYADSTGWDCDNVNVIAWHPLPEPYTEDSNGE